MPVGRGDPLEEHQPVVNEAGRRWLCGELAGSEYFATVLAARFPQAWKEVATRLDRTHGTAKRPGQRRFVELLGP